MQTVDTVRDMQGVLHAVTEVSGLPTAIFSRINHESWCARAVLDGGGFGIRSGEVHSLRELLCADVRNAATPIAIADLTADERYRTHPTRVRFGAQAYVGVPVQFDGGEVIGTLSAIGKSPHSGIERAVPLMSLLAQLVAHELQLEDHARDTENRLLREQLTSEERERFLALVAHDLRNPLAAIRLHAELLAKQVGPNQRALTERVLAITARMVRLIDDLLDLSRGRVGSGIMVRPGHVDPRHFLETRLAEIQTANPGAELQLELLPLPSSTDAWDPDRVAQLLDNVVGNAIQHGAGEPVKISARALDEFCQIDVVNGGAAIPDDVLETLFEPFHRTSAPGRGLGLGLYIANEIARAHGGGITATSRDGRTCVSVVLPFTPSSSGE